MTDLDKLVELEQESLPATQPRVFDSQNYYEVWKEASDKYEKLLTEFKMLQEDNKKKEELISTYIRYLDTFEQRVIPMSAVKLKSNLAFLKEDEMIYICVTGDDKIEIWSEEKYEKWAEKTGRGTEVQTT